MEEIYKTIFHFFATQPGFFSKPQYTIKHLWCGYTLLHYDYSLDEMKKAVKELEKKRILYVTKTGKVGLTAYGIAHGLKKFNAPLFWDMFENQTKEIEGKKV